MFTCNGIRREMMFDRPTLPADDLIRQHRIPGNVAALIDAGRLRGTHANTLSSATNTNLREARRRLELWDPRQAAHRPAVASGR